MNDTLYCIIHTKYQDNRVDNILSTWGQKQDILFYSDHSIPEKNIYKVCETSDYSSGQIKQINVFNLIKEKFYNYKWYFFCDNDTFVNTKKVEQYIQKNINTSCAYGEIINTWPNDPSLFYLSGGAGLLMHGNLVNSIKNLKYHDTPFGDVSLGINLKDQNIPIKHCNLFHSQTPIFYNLEDSEIINNISFHYITTAEYANNLWKYLV